jgi:IclR family transcriptional regulator, acetate operon repressor
MAVKALRSATRVLSVLESVASLQPVGLAAVARHLEEDKSAVQRALATLAEDGWIRPAAGVGVRWELTTRVLVMASHATRRSDLRERARPVLEGLRDDTGESVLLAVADPPRVVTLDVVESRQLVRAAPHVGMVLPLVGSAAVQALLAHLPPEEVGGYLGHPPGRRELADLAAVRRRGWALNQGAVHAESSGVAAAVLGADGRAVAAISVSAPTQRLPKARHAEVAALVVTAASSLSAG